MSNRGRMLVIGDGTVAAELAAELERTGHQVDAYVLRGLAETGNDHPLAYLNIGYDKLLFFEYAAVWLAFTSDREGVRRVVEELELHVTGDTLFMVSAMGASSTEMASLFRHPGRVIGFGFLPPLACVKTIELARPMQSRTKFDERAVHMIRGLGREALFVKDSAGLALPRVVSMIVNEAVIALSEGVATAEDIDTAMKLGTNYPYGPLEWADRIGLDQVYATLCALHEEQGEDRYRPAPMLRRMVLAGKFGVRTGCGFYTYEGVEA